MTKILTTLAASAAFAIGLALVPQTAAACGGCGCNGAAAEKGVKACDHKPGECDCGKADQKVSQEKAPKAFAKKPAVGTKATCPVMGGEFTVTKQTEMSEYKGKYYAFCCPGCKPKFDKNPGKYTK